MMISMDRILLTPLSAVTAGECLRIWAIPRPFKCPVIGTCLNTEEHRRVVKKNGININPLKTHELHSIIMSHLDNENALSRRIDNLLRKKYQNTLDHMKSLTVGQIESCWRQAFQAGDFDAELFFIATKPGLPEKLLEDVFGEVHMISHTLIEQAIKTKQKIDHLERQLREREEQIESYKKCLRDWKRETKLKPAETVRSGHSPIRVCSVEVAVESGRDLSPCEKMDRGHFEHQLHVLQQDNLRLVHLVERREKENTVLAKQLEENAALNDHLKSDIEDLISHFAALAECQKPRAIFNDKTGLCAKKILIVGGMTKIRHLYQHLVESNGGSFEYHDGCMKNGSKNLEHLVRRSDLILCPVNCNSHGACSQVKKMCTRHGKPLRILSRASVSAISTALFSEKTD